MLKILIVDDEPLARENLCVLLQPVADVIVAGECENAVEALGAICRENGLTLIYDAAQAFGCRYASNGLLNYGDYSICSFHATKLFHTAEGGCVVSHSASAHQALSRARAFGHEGDTHYCLGINAKMSELHAAMGLSLLPGTDEEIARRKHVHDAYGCTFFKRVTSTAVK